MISKNMKEKLLLLLIVVLVFAGSIISGLELISRLDRPETCNSCHEMQQYYRSYLDPQNGSLISSHELNCIQCHANRSIYDARKEVAIEIIIHRLNLSGDFKPSRLEPNCPKCHSLPATDAHISTNMTDCAFCHWAHKPGKALSVSNISLLPLITSGSHRNQTCMKCHGTNFERPDCVNCHKGHGEQKLENRLCLICHIDPHVPRKPGIFPNNTVNFTKDLPFSVCQPCHENEYFNLTNIPTLHTDMQTCSLCHDAHGRKPQCSKCHPGMMLDKHPSDFKCDTCHATFKGGIRITCEDCHGKSHEWSKSTAIINPK